MGQALSSFRGLASLFYPATCVVCGRSAEDGEHLCRACAEKAPRIVPPFCAKCSEAFPGAIDQEFVCANCGHRALDFEAAVSAYRSRGVVRLVILKFKYGRELHLRHPIGDWLLEAMRDARLTGCVFDFIVPVPLHPARLRERGFNQAELLAKILSLEISVPLQNALERVRYTTTQTLFDRQDRMENLRNAFRLRKRIDVRGYRVLLVDDVLTTGSTLSECGRILRKAGAKSVHAITAARA